MTPIIEEAIARVPQWASATDLKASPLTGGITNENFPIEVNGDVFVLRIPGQIPNYWALFAQPNVPSVRLQGK